MKGHALETHFKYDNETVFYDRIELLAAVEGAKTARLSELFCNYKSRQCRALIDNISLFKDNNHLSTSGAKKFVGPWLTKHLEGL